MIDSENYDEKVDIWALGCVIYEMKNKKPIFEGKCKN